MATLQTGNPFAILGVPRGASPQEVQAAYLEAAKLFHPDRLPPELAELRELAAKVFTAVTEAHKQLSDPDRRRALDRTEPS
jgi:curved DNA-binding protein CbpA